METWAKCGGMKHLVGAQGPAGITKASSSECPAAEDKAAKGQQQSLGVLMGILEYIFEMSHNQSS